LFRIAPLSHLQPDLPLVVLDSIPVKSGASDHDSPYLLSFSQLVICTTIYVKNFPVFVQVFSPSLFTFFRLLFLRLRLRNAFLARPFFHHGTIFPPFSEDDPALLCFPFSVFEPGWFTFHCYFFFSGGLSGCSLPPCVSCPGLFKLQPHFVSSPCHRPRPSVPPPLARLSTLSYSLNW